MTDNQKKCILFEFLNSEKLLKELLYKIISCFWSTVISVQALFGKLSMMIDQKISLSEISDIIFFFIVSITAFIVRYLKWIFIRIFIFKFNLCFYTKYNIVGLMKTLIMPLIDYDKVSDYRRFFIKFSFDIVNKCFFFIFVFRELISFRNNWLTGGVTFFNFKIIFF